VIGGERCLVRTDRIGKIADGFSHRNRWTGHPETETKNRTAGDRNEEYSLATLRNAVVNRVEHIGMEIVANRQEPFCKKLNDQVV